MLKQLLRIVRNGGLTLVAAIAVVVVPTAAITTITWKTLSAVEAALPQSGLDALRELSVMIHDITVLDNRLDLARIAPTNPESAEKLRDANDFAYIRFVRQNFSKIFTLFPELSSVGPAMEGIIEDVDTLLERGMPFDPVAASGISATLREQRSLVSQFYYRFANDTEGVLREQQEALSDFRLELAAFLLLVCALGGASVVLLVNLTAVLRRIRYISNHDALTGLANRSWFVENSFRPFGEADKIGMLMLLDLDRFKEVNDTFGHIVGDLLLKEAARRFRTAVRTEDIVVRLGGDEFAIIVPKLTALGEAMTFADRVTAAFSGVVDLQGHRVPLSCSIGVAIWPDHGVTIDELMVCADLALYAAKRAGRGRSHFYTEALSDELTSRLAMEGAISRALNREEFSLVWQPQVNLATGRVDGVEVLIRWFDRERSLWVAPNEFIRVAESSELIFKIDRFVLRAACLEGAAIHAALGRPLRISVNVSGGNFERADFPDLVAATLAETGYPAGLLELEITEGVLIRNRQASGEIMNRLSELGIRVALDDFGTGYSSLSYFEELKVDRLKIDRSFLKGIDRSGRKQSIIQAIIQFARSIDVETVGEGVETASHLQALEAVGCTSVQGFLISPPLKADEFVKWCQRAPTVPASTLTSCGRRGSAGYPGQLTENQVGTQAPLVADKWSSPLVAHSGSAIGPRRLPNITTKRTLGRLMTGAFNEFTA